MLNDKEEPDNLSVNVEKETPEKLVYEPPKLKKFEKLQKLIVSGE